MGNGWQNAELRELRYFHAVARTGSFGRAARALRISQPAVTTQVRRLEEQLGAQLLTRHGRGMILTPAGSSLMERLDVVFGLLNAPLDEPATPGQTTGTLTLALLPEVAPLVVPRLLAACEARLPGVTITIHGGVSASLEEWVLDRRADIALLQDPPALDGLLIEPVVTESLRFDFGRPRHIPRCDEIRCPPAAYRAQVGAAAVPALDPQGP